MPTDSTTAYSTEAELVAALQEGSEDAFEALTNRYQNRLYRLAHGITLDPEESHDIVQEVFLTAFKAIGSFKAESRLGTWLHRITVNTALNWRRKWKRRFRWRHHSLDGFDQDYLDEFKTDQDTPENRYTQRELHEVIQDGLAGLPEQARTVFVLKEMEGLSYDEIADILKIKRGTVSSRLFYARKQLKERLSKYL